MCPIRSPGAKFHDRIKGWLAYNAPRDPYDLFVLNLLSCKPRDLVLDCGTGNGRYASRLAFESSDVVALDINPTLIKAAKKNMKENGNVHVIQADMTNLPFLHGCFDKIICVHNLWYVADYQKAILEMRNVLRSNGVLVVDHLNLFDPVRYCQVAFYVSLAFALAKKRIPDIGRTLKTLLRPFKGTKFQLWCIVTYDPLQIIKGVRQFARRFIIRCTIE